MKKVFALVAVAALFAACAGNTQPQAEAEAAAPAEEVKACCAGDSAKACCAGDSTAVADSAAAEVAEEVPANE